MEKWPPILFATRYRDFDEIDRLLKNGVDINIQDVAGSTALHVASYDGDFEMVKFLIQCGANISIKDKDGDTPVINATQNNHNSIALYLVDMRNKQNQNCK